MSRFPDFGRDRDDPIPQLIADAPLEGVAEAAGLQGAASILYVVCGLFTSFAAWLASASRVPDQTAINVIVFLGFLGMFMNWVLSAVASAMLAFANTRAKARGVGVALLVFSVLGLQSLGSLFVMVGASRMRGFGGPGAGMGVLEWEVMGGISLIFFGIFEVTRLSLIGWYVAVAAPLGRSELSGAGQALGILTPAMLVGALLMSFLVSLASAGHEGLGRDAGAVIVLGNLAMFAGLVIFGAALMLRLSGAVKARRRLTEY